MIANLSFNGLKIENIASGSFHACQYENDWYLDIANFALIKNQDLNIKFMHQKALQFSAFGPVGMTFAGSQ